MEQLVLVLASYILGALPFGYIVAKYVKGIDITSRGSGNIGATNVWRTLGPVPAFLVLAADLGKGAIAVWLGQSYGSPGTELLTGAAAIIGHGWSVFLSFRGGKMIATSGGVLFVLSPMATFGALLVWVLTLALTRFVSLASIMAAVSIPVFFAIIGFRDYHLLFVTLVAAVAIFKHRSNIKRLISGTEFKFGTHNTAKR